MVSVLHLWGALPPFPISLPCLPCPPLSLSVLHVHEAVLIKHGGN